MTTIYAWVLVMMLYPSGNGKAQITIDMRTKEACLLARQSYAQRGARATCLNKETGEVID